MSIKEKLNSVKEKIIQSAIESGRSPHEIKLIAVSKKKPIEMIKEAISANQIIFGENYVQEALEKIKKIGKKQEIEWHFLGRLQKNKVKFCPGNFQWIHTLDSIELSQKIESHCTSNNKIMNVLIQVNLSQEDSKSGLKELSDVLRLAEKVSLCKSIKLRGLMSIPQPSLGEIKTRKIFEQIRNWKDILQNEFKTSEISELSIGMTTDYIWAIKEGATMIRLGTAIFGSRD